MRSNKRVALKHAYGELAAALAETIALNVALIGKLDDSALGG